MLTLGSMKRPFFLSDFSESQNINSIEPSMFAFDFYVTVTKNDKYMEKLKLSLRNKSKYNQDHSDPSEMKGKYVFSRFWGGKIRPRRNGSTMGVYNEVLLTCRLSGDISELSLGYVWWQLPRKLDPCPGR